MTITRILFLAAFLLTTGLSVQAQFSADTPGANICLYRPDHIVTYNPAQRDILVMTGFYGGIRMVDAVNHLQKIERFTGTTVDYDRAVVAIQYSWSANPGRAETAKGISLRAYITDPEMASQAPDASIHQAVRQYLFGFGSIRSTYGYWLLKAVEDPINRPCNNWR